MFSTREKEMQRHKMWCNLLGSEYLSADKNKKKHMKQTYAKSIGLEVWQVPFVNSLPTPLDLPTLVDDDDNDDDFNFIPTEEENMFNERETQIEHLDNRFYYTKLDLADKARKHFGLTTPRPETIGEAKKWLADGNFIFDAANLKDEADYAPHCLNSFFRWGKKPRDDKGYTAWEEKMDKAYNKAKDQNFLSYEAGLAALKDFESFTIH